MQWYARLGTHDALFEIHCLLVTTTMWLHLFAVVATIPVAASTSLHVNDYPEDRDLFAFVTVSVYVNA